MEWSKLLSARRLGSESYTKMSDEASRSEFQRDYDRLIFSSPFRRLQNKTQVFPLPGSVFVHNRLTHSLEVASVGRSLGNMVSIRLLQKSELKGIALLHELGTIVSTACLAHDLGNPPFGHSGEKAISRFFKEGIGKEIQRKVTPEQWLDLIEFEGNANAFRLLTHQFTGRRKGGFAMTFTTLASLMKYPYGSEVQDLKKYGFFNSEKETFAQIAQELGIRKLQEQPMVYARHPLVFLVEAADDISYLIMDVEDAHKLKILSTEETMDLLGRFFADEPEFFKKRDRIFQEVFDTNEQVGYMRAMAINKLTTRCTEIFLEHYESIMEGKFRGGLVNHLQGTLGEGMEYCQSVSTERIYKHRSVVEIELAGYNILGELVSEFVSALFKREEHYSSRLLSLLPVQFYPKADDLYTNIRYILDFISGMTDLYAVDLYRKIKGISV